MMKIHKILFILAIVSFLAVGCKNETKKEEATQEQKTEIAADTKDLSLNISGMTCEIGCARKIASDLSKKEGVLEANVVFNDSIATIKYDANKTSKADLIAFVEGIGSGDMYKASEAAKKTCKTDCTMACCAAKKADKKSCETDCKKECCTKTETEKKACKEGCTMACCTENKKA
ncbi:cation transporter [Tenacibaculum sp. 1_MG-2023]|uniref:cation transporter n=1 Tax=Tenacibaculum sp. 1_MG-2023 TaxID=3062653 RepID=UPI0026E31D8D|nr:cation transporter [Tenacibaculum sp. 1_MG-2023]MDO6674067.1 cation transporter [Tenacibaculum sp. 1_MG-2023]